MRPGDAPQAGSEPKDSPLKAARRLQKAGRSNEALLLLRDSLRRDVLSAEEVDTAGRFILGELASGSVEGKPPLRILCLGQCTTTWLCTSLAAVAWGMGTPCAVSEGAFDNILQELADIGKGKRERPDVLVLLPWSQRLLRSGSLAPEEGADSEIAFWRQVWASAESLGLSRVVQIGYDWVHPGPEGFHLGEQAGNVLHLIRSVNESLRVALPKGAYFVPLEAISGTSGRSRFYDMRRYHWTKQPFSELGTLLLARHVFAGIRALTTGAKKVLVLDLDNTCWGGVVGETGPLGIDLGGNPDGEAFRSFQAYLKTLASRGILLAICSKNNPEDARGPFEQNPNMVLALSDFAAFEAIWGPKAESIRKISQGLNLGLDSFVFFDDSKVEQEHIRQALPEVAVVDVPGDPSEFVRSLQEGLWFETLQLTAEDQQRTAYYLAEQQRQGSGANLASMEEYLQSLEMAASLDQIHDGNMQRVVQLLAKTNQFNLTTRRHTEEEVRRMLEVPGALGLTLHLKDKFGDYGLVGLVLAMPAPEAGAGTLVIETLLMSCRVIGRTVEHFLMNRVAEAAVALGLDHLLGEYDPTPKNQVVRGFWEAMGFQRVSPTDATPPLRFESSVKGYVPRTTFVRLQG